MSLVDGARSARGRPAGIGIRRLLLPVLLIGAMSVAWIILGPTALGGHASYVVTDGTSMLPHFRADGLVITQSEGTYRVGEVVAYHNRQLHTVVMHRIVAREDNRYVFKGDNNSYLDAYHAKASDLVGKEWLYWSGAGRYLRDLQNPLTFAIIIGGIAYLAARAFAPQRSRRRRRHHS